MLVSLVSMLTFGHPIRPLIPAPVLKYRVEIKSEVTLGAKGDPDYLHDLTEATAFVSLTMTDTTVGRFAAFLVDSMIFNGGEDAMDAAMQQPALLKNPKGATVRFLVVGGEPDTRLVAPVITPMEENIPLGTLLSALPAFFPGMKKDVKVGAAWADTVKSPEPGVLDVITSWKVTAGEGEAMLYTGTRSNPRRTASPDSSVMVGKESATHELTTTALGPVRRVNTATLMSGLITGGQAPPEGVAIKTVRTLKITPLP